MPKKKGELSVESFDPLEETIPPPEEALPPPSIDLTKSDAPTTASRKRGFGHLPDPLSAADFNAGMLLGGAPVNLPSEVDLRAHVDEIFDQGVTNSCVAQAAVGALETRLAMQGRRAKLSTAEPYKVARALARASISDKLTDDGCYPRLLMSGMKKVGVCLASDLPFDIAKIDDELPWDVLQRASAHKIAAWYRVAVGGDARLQQVAHALAKGYPVIFGAIVGQAFMDAGRNTLLKPERVEPKGGHMVGAYGYRGEGRARQFLIRNSYGTTWADGGFAWADAEFLSEETSTDFYVITV